MIVHDDFCFLEAALASFARVSDRYVFVSQVPWNGEPGDWERSAQIAESAGAVVVAGEWRSEEEHRAAAFDHLRSLGFSHALIPDSDEVIDQSLLAALIKIAENDLADRVYVEWDTYWKDSGHVVRPRERFTPCILLNLERAWNTALRGFEGGRALLLNDSYGVIHHLSYAGSDERIQRKITTWSHKNEVVEGWYDRVWKGWDSNRLMQAVHPTHPEAYGFIEAIETPQAMIDAGVQPVNRQKLELPGRWPSISVIIPLHGGEEDIERCLEALCAYPSLLHEVIVVDNASPDKAAEIADDLCKRLPNGRVIRLEENKGFAAGCNAGFAASGGEVVIYLNSDAVMPRSGLIRMIESLIASGSIAASGPLSNSVGHFQLTGTTYTSFETLDSFADEFAQRQAADTDVDMLVGFCLAVRRQAIEEVGGFDEGFGLGTFEDNDLCYRLRRAGWRLVISQRSFVHHEGSMTIRRVIPEPGSLLAQNQARYLAKWREDIELGFASTLSGLSQSRIVFDASRDPKGFWDEVRSLKDQAQITLCMIVRDEERVLDSCLASASPFFSQIIVVDTGSTDSTKEIASRRGVDLKEIVWPDSFAEARNESLRGAKGRWIFWMDADDTLPPMSGMALLKAATKADSSISGFVVPVRFTDEGPQSGVQVDHVKLFRNLPGLEFEGRIHEQILPSLRRLSPSGSIARLDAHVLHSGYDTSPEGQAKKRVRDEKLLKLDLDERPGHPFVLFNLGMTAHYSDDHEEAIEWLDKCLEASREGESHVRKAYALKGISLRRLGRVDDAIEAFEQGLELVGDDPELHFQLGHLYAERGQNELAKERYLACLETDASGAFTSFDRGIQGFKTMHNLAAVHVGLRDYEGARKWFLTALNQAPEFLPSAFALFDSAVDVGDRQTAEAMLTHVGRFGPERESLHLMETKFRRVFTE